MIVKLIAVISLLGLFAGCSQPATSPTPEHCANYIILNGAQPDCFIFDRGTLIQTGLNQQVQLTINDSEITVVGTIVVDTVSSDLTIAVLEGTTIVGTQNKIHTVNTGQQITLNSDRLITPYVIENMANLPINILQRSVNIPEPTATIEIVPTATLACPRPETWTLEYMVQSGDTLSSIANAAAVSLEDLQTYNCINNPNNIRIGVVLIMPEGSLSATQPAVTFTPSAVLFRADKVSIIKGECTTLRWDVQNVREVMLESSLMNNQSSLEICPVNTATYTLTVSYFDESQSQHQVVIEVASS